MTTPSLISVADTAAISNSSENVKYIKNQIHYSTVQNSAQLIVARELRMPSPCPVRHHISRHMRSASTAKQIPCSTTKLGHPYRKPSRLRVPVSVPPVQRLSAPRPPHIVTDAFGLSRPHYPKTKAQFRRSKSRRSLQARGILHHQGAGISRGGRNADFEHSSSAGPRDFEAEVVHLPGPDDLRAAHGGHPPTVGATASDAFSSRATLARFRVSRVPMLCGFLRASHMGRAFR